MFIGLALVMLATSCSTDTTDVNLNGAKVNLGVSLDQTRTYMGELTNGEYPVLWSEGDNILVNNKSVAVPAEYAGKASLQVAVDAAEDYKVAYPAELVDGNELTISEVQKYVDGSFAVGSGVMVGYSADAANLTLKNLYGYLKFTVTAAANVDAVTVIANGGEAISGVYAIDYKEATIAPLAGKDIIRVTEVVAKDGVATVVVAVPAGQYSEGFSVKVKDNANGVMVKNLKGQGAAIEAGVVYAMPEVAYAATETEAEITTVTELQAFIAAVNTVVEVAEGETAPCTYTAWISADGEVKLGADLDLTGVTLEPINTFDGVFNGQGYSIKNWNTNRGLFVLNTGVVKNVVIDASCTLAIDYSTFAAGDKNGAFIVEDNEESGLVTGCVSNGNISASNLSTGAHRIGAIVGVSYGIVSNCINNGNVSITAPTIANMQIIGGVVGYCNPNAGTKEALGKVFLSDCINNGNVTILFPCQPKTVFVGGVLGGTQTAKSSAAVHLGTIKNCVNNGDVSYRFETLSSGTYGNVGGVIGYAQVDLYNCDNYGKVSFTTPVADLNQGGTRPAAGGVVGCNLYTVENCNNYGELFVEGCWAAGTNDNSGAGSQGGSSFGGVVGCSGIYNVYTADKPVKNCHNYGTVNVNNNCKLGGGTKGFQAGVVAYTSNDVIDCTSNGPVNIKCNIYTHYSSGVVGEAKGGVYNCSVNAPVSVEMIGGTKDQSGEYYMAGVVGYASVGVDNCHLNANFTAKTTNAQGSLRFTGVVGQVKTASTRSVTIKNCSVAKGVKMSLEFDNIKANYCGAIVGLGNNGVSDCVNNGEMNIKVTTPLTGTGISYIGSVVGSQQEDMYDCTNNGAVTVDMNNSTSPLYAGGILGSNKKTGAAFSACHNTANVAFVNCGNTDNIGIYVGQMVDGATADFSACTNTGVVSVNGQELVAPATLSIDGKRWQLPADIAEMFTSVPTAVVVADLGVSVAGQLAIAVDYESIYGSQAAGYWAPQVMVAYEVQATDATSGKVLVKQTDHFGDVTTTEAPYSNLTADSVVIDFTNLLGIPGTGPCTLYTGEVNLSGGGVM